MQKIKNDFYNAFMENLYQIDRYHYNFKIRKMRYTMLNNLHFALAKAYDRGELSWDKVIFYNRKINDYLRIGE